MKKRGESSENKLWGRAREIAATTIASGLVATSGVEAVKAEPGLPPQESKVGVMKRSDTDENPLHKSGVMKYGNTTARMGEPNQREARDRTHEREYTGTFIVETRAGDLVEVEIKSKVDILAKDKDISTSIERALQRSGYRVVGDAGQNASEVVYVELNFSNIEKGDRVKNNQQGTGSWADKGVEAGVSAIEGIVDASIRKGVRVSNKKGGSILGAGASRAGTLGRGKISKDSRNRNRKRTEEQWEGSVVLNYLATYNLKQPLKKPEQHTSEVELEVNQDGKNGDYWVAGYTVENGRRIKLGERFFASQPDESMLRGVIKTFMLTDGDWVEELQLSVGKDSSMGGNPTSPLRTFGSNDQKDVFNITGRKIRPRN